MLGLMLITYNDIEIIEKTVESLLNQNTEREYNIYISDDWSHDGTYEYLKKIANENKNVYLSQPEIKKKVGNNRNNAISMNKDDYGVFIDSDDVQDDDYVAKIYAGIDSEHELFLMNYKIIKKNGFKFINQQQKSFTDWGYHLGVNFAVWKFVFPKKVYKSLTFNENVSMGEDALVIARYLGPLKKIKAIDACYTLNRVQEESLTRGKNEKLVKNMEVLISEFEKEDKNQYIQYVENLMILKYLFVAIAYKRIDKKKLNKLLKKIKLNQKGNKYVFVRGDKIFYICLNIAKFLPLKLSEFMLLKLTKILIN